MPRTKEQEKEKNRRYRKLYPELDKRRKQEWYTRNKEYERRKKLERRQEDPIKIKEQQKTWYQTRKQAKKEANLKWKLTRLNLEEQEYRNKLAAGCEICGSLDKLCIDHDHNCCKAGCAKCYRGILCSTCNSGVGFFRDSIPDFESALKYLKKGKKCRTSQSC